jgi:hypothetical protein
MAYIPPLIMLAVTSRIPETPRSTVKIVLLTCPCCDPAVLADAADDGSEVAGVADFVVGAFIVSCIIATPSWGAA